jgi:hypothetical protein
MGFRTTQFLTESISRTSVDWLPEQYLWLRLPTTSTMAPQMNSFVGLASTVRLRCCTPIIF